MNGISSSLLAWFKRPGCILAVSLLLTGHPAGAEPPPESAAPPDRVSPDLSALPSLSVSAVKTEAYPGEEIAVSVRLSYPAELAVRDIRFPRLPHPGLMIHDAGPAKTGGEERNGTSWSTLEFPYFVTGRKPGYYRLGPITLDCSILTPAPAPGAAGFFRESELQRRQLRNDGVAVTVVPFPAEGRPADFRGAVGEFRLDVTATPRELPPGAPLTVTTRIEGEAGLDTVSCPTMGDTADFTAYPLQVRKGRLAVVCEQVLVPKHAAVTSLPPVRFSFFNPERGEYRTLVEGPLTIRIIPPVVRETPSRQPSPPPAAASHGSETATERRASSRRDGLTGTLCWLLLIPVVAAGGFVRWRSRTLPSGAAPGDDSPPGEVDGGGDEGLEAIRDLLVAGDSAGFYDALFRTLQGRLGRYLQLRPHAITADIVNALGENGVTEPLVSLVGELFRDLDRARYAGGAHEPDRKNMLRKLEELMIFLEKP